jgi:hypothetical protein
MTKQPNRIQVKETTLIDSYSFEGKLEEIIEMLQDWKNEGEWEGIVIESIGYDGAVEYYLYKHRLETDKEYEKRMKLLEEENRKKVKEKEKRRIQYEMLKKEFGDT